MIYGIRLLEVLRHLSGIETHLVMSGSAKLNVSLETDWSVSDVEGLADEGLTWRVAQSARARQQADHPSLADLSDLGEDSDAFRAILDAALKNEIWRKPRR